jgi:hypothetical protein
MSNIELFSRGELDADEAELLKSALEAQDQAVPLEGILSLLKVSGLYKWTSLTPPIPIASPSITGVEPGPTPTAEGAGPGEALLPIVFLREELRLDVDGYYPQLTASGTLFRDFLMRVHWIAKLTQIGPSIWSGTIWYKDGNVAAFPYTSVKIVAVRSPFPAVRSATVIFSGGGVVKRVRTYRFVSNYFHQVDFEYDHEVGIVPASPELTINTCAHPNRPATLPCQTLSIETVFKRAGFDARNIGNASPIPNDGPDPGTNWSDAELHDAMQTYWSRFANTPQWALWTFFGKQHDLGFGLGGIMFDDIGPNHRQGTAIFYKSFISDAPAGDPNPAAAVSRLHFWTAVHEMGHAFNLAHSWQKQLGTPWIPLAAEPEARSFMNYPYSVAGGESAFFADFEYRFSNNELLFMRHAPERFVQQGNADWFDHHGFEGVEGRGTRSFELEIAVDRTQAHFDFLEPVVLEIKLTNVSGVPKIVPEDILLDTERMVVILKKDNKAARRWVPFSKQCRRAGPKVLQPGDEITESLFVSAGINGWDLAEPGFYNVQMSLEIDGPEPDLVSNALRLRVAPPKSYDEEYVAQEVHTDAAGRVMAFDGSMVLESGLNAWRELAEKLPDSKAATHARIALALPLTRDYRVLRVGATRRAGAADSKADFAIAKTKPDEARKRLKEALLENGDTAISTLGRVDYEYYAGKFAAWLDEKGDEKAAKQVGDAAQKVSAKLARRHPVPKSRGAGKAAAE